MIQIGEVAQSKAAMRKDAHRAAKAVRFPAGYLSTLGALGSKKKQQGAQTSFELHAPPAIDDFSGFLRFARPGEPLASKAAP